MVNFAAGQSIGPTAINQLQDNIAALCDQLGEEYGRVQCNEISGVIDNGECVEIPNPLASNLENNAGIIDQKIIALSFQPNVSYVLPDGPAGIPSSTNGSVNSTANTGTSPTGLTWTLSVKCGGNVVHLDSGSSNGMRLIQAHIDCPRNDEIEICFDAVVVGGFGGQLVASAKYCGVVLCAGSEKRTLDGLFKPPPIPEGCCYSREHLYLASQNLDALCTSLLTDRSQYAYCVQGTSDEIDSIVVAANLPAETQYFVWGEIFICYRNDSQDTDWTISVDPFIGCESSNAQCLGFSAAVPRTQTDSSIGFVQCTSIPVVTCGSCPAGESITAGLTYDEECAQEVPTAVGSGRVVITSVSQKYCIWLFSDVQIDGLPPATDLVLGSCMTDAALLPLQEKYEALKATISDLDFVNLTRRNIGPLSGEGPQDWLFQSAQPWPPAAPLPRPIPDLAPPKKWNLDVRVCSAFTDLSRQRADSMQSAAGVLKLQVKCGDTIIVDRETSWIIQQFGGSDLDQVRDFGTRCLSFSDCIECAIDEEIRICAEFSIYNSLFGFSFDSTSVVDLQVAKAFCF